MQNISLTAAPSYAEQLAKAQYQQKMAEMLQQQSQAPIDIQSYKGTQAPIPWTAVLAKVLQSYGGNVMQKRALEGQAGAESLAHSNMMDALNAGAKPQAPAGPGAMDAMSAPNAPPENAGLQLASVLAMGGASPSDAGPPPAPMPPPVADNPMNPQAASQNAGLAQALQGNAPPTQGMPPASAPPMPQPPMQQAPPAAPSNVYSDPLSQAQAKLSQLQTIATSPQIGPTQRAQLVPMIADTRKQIDTLTTEKLKADAEESKRQSGLISIGKAIDGLNVPPEVKAAAHAATASNPDGAKGILDAIAASALRPKERFATPDEVKAAGFPPKSVVQVNDSGKATLIVNGQTQEIANRSIAATEANVRTSQGQLGVSRQRLKIEKTREARMASAGLNEQQQTALDTAVAEGRIDPTRLNSRNAKIQADILLHNPGANFVNSHAIAAMTANPAFQSKALIAGALPEVLQNVRDAGKKLDFSKVSYIGKLQAFEKKTLNDPDFVEYMNQRADAMQTVSNVMRATGATDQSIKMEAEAAPITMSPEAFDGWYAGQMKTLAPRISRMTPLTIQSSRATPTAPAPYTDPAKEAEYQAYKKAHPK
jgi:hypothetical protein